MKIEYDASFKDDEAGYIIRDESGIRFSGTVEAMATYFASTIQESDRKTARIRELEAENERLRKLAMASLCDVTRGIQGYCWVDQTSRSTTKACARS